MTDVKDRVFNAVVLLGGCAIASIFAMFFLKEVKEMGGDISPGMVAVPYNKGADRWTANELHVLNKNLEQVVSSLNEVKNRLGGLDLDRIIATLDDMKSRIATPLEEIRNKLSEP